MELKKLHTIDMREVVREHRVRVKWSVLYFILTGCVVAILSTILITARPTDSFPVARVVPVRQGMGVREVAQTLKEYQVIRSALLFTLTVRFAGYESSLKAGDYFFEQPLTLFEVAKKLVAGDFGLTPERVRIPEGATVEDIALIFDPERFPNFNREEFLVKAGPYEGMLFPDTYLFLPNVTADQVVNTMYGTFLEKMTEVMPDITASGRNVYEVIVMASIIQKEAWKEDDQKLISGVLWNRIDRGMPLQVDATFGYINGKNTYELTYEDLKIDSPYNTYKYKGLPPTPISNPGLSALHAAASPTPSDYLYYLADRSGNTYYAKDFEEHKQNKFRYVR